MPGHITCSLRKTWLSAPELNPELWVSLLMTRWSGVCNHCLLNFNILLFNNGEKYSYLQRKWHSLISIYCFPFPFSLTDTGSQSWLINYQNQSVRIGEILWNGGGRKMRTFLIGLLWGEIKYILTWNAKYRRVCKKGQLSNVCPQIHAFAFLKN